MQLPWRVRTMKLAAWQWFWHYLSWRVSQVSINRILLSPAISTCTYLMKTNYFSFRRKDSVETNLCTTASKAISRGYQDCSAFDSSREFGSRDWWTYLVLLSGCNLQQRRRNTMLQQNHRTELGIIVHWRKFTWHDERIWLPCKAWYQW